LAAATLGDLALTLGMGTSLLSSSSAGTGALAFKVLACFTMLNGSKGL